MDSRKFKATAKLKMKKAHHESQRYLYDTEMAILRPTDP
jgi:hypothetical protein